MASKNLPGLVIKIGAETKGAIDGLNKVNSAVAKSGDTSNRAAKTWKKIGPALGAVGVAAAAVAVKIGVDSVKAFMEDEKAAASLNKTLSNLGFGSASTQVAAFVDDLQWATATSEEELRPALQAIITSVKDVAKAEQILKLATDMAAAGVGDLSTVSGALSKAASGNMKAINSLTKGALDPATIKAKDFAGVMQQLSDLYGGQAAANMETLAGKMKLLTEIAIPEMQEAFGRGLAQGFMGEAGQSLDDIKAKMRENEANIQAFGEAISTLLGWIVEGFSFVRQFFASFARMWTTFFDDIYGGIIEVRHALGFMSDAEYEAAKAAQVAAKAAHDQAYAEDVLGYKFGSATDAANGAADANNIAADSGYNAAGGADAAAGAMDREKSAADKLRDALDKLNGKNRTLIRDRIALRRAMSEGPSKGKDGTVTRDDQKSWALDVAEAAEAVAQAELDKGGKGSRRRAARALSQARRSIGKKTHLGKDFVDSILSTPDELTANGAATTAPGTTTTTGTSPYPASTTGAPAFHSPTPQSGLPSMTPGMKPPVTNGGPADPTLISKWSPYFYQQPTGGGAAPTGVTNIFQFGDLTVKDPADAASQATKAARLAALGRSALNTGVSKWRYQAGAA